MLQRLALVLLGLSPLLLLEVGLRLFGNPPDAPPKGFAWTTIAPFELRGDDVVTKRSFLPAIRPARFKIKKPPGSHRIFCLGGSSTFGYPYGPELAWPSLLESRLQALTPTAGAEVINLGGNSYGSARNLGTLRGTLAYNPDVVVVYAGMNEFVEDSYLEAIEARPLLFDFLDSLRVYRLLADILPVRKDSRPAPLDPGSRTGALFFSPDLSGKIYAATPERRRMVAARFSRNIERMAVLARERSIPLLLCTTPSNLKDWSPERNGSAPPSPDLARRWRQLIARARALENGGRPDEAASAYLEAATLWDGSAEMCFLLGRVLLASGRTDEAGPWFTRARDLDSASIRATTEMNEILRTVARKYSLPLVDLEKSFAEASPGKLVGDELILDFVHPTPRGATLIAREVWQTLTTLGAPWSVYRPEDDREQSARERLIAGGEPAISSNIAYTWGAIFERKGMNDQAIGMFEKAVSLGQPFPYVYKALGAALARRGETGRAVEIMEKLAREHPEYAEAYPLLADLYQDRGEIALALRAYARAIETAIPDALLLSRYAILLSEQGDHAGALAILERGKSLEGAGCRLDSTRGFVLEGAGREPEALGLFKEIIGRDPGCHAAWENLGLLQMHQGRWEQAARTFEEALRRPGTPPPLHHLNLGYVYFLGLKNLPAAMEQFRAYLDADPTGTDKIPKEVAPLLLEPVDRGR